MARNMSRNMVRFNVVRDVAWTIARYEMRNMARSEAEKRASMVSKLIFGGLILHFPNVDAVVLYVEREELGS